MASTPSGKPAAGYGSSTVDRALDILTAIAETPDGMTNPQISQALGLDRSTAHRLVATLERRGLIQRLPNRHYIAGPGLGYLAFAAAPDPRLTVQPFLAELVQLTGESASFSIHHGEHFHCIAHHVSPHELSYCPTTGTSYPLNSGAAGLALWAFLPQAVREELLTTAELPSFTASTITDRGALRAELDTIARRGYATSAGVRTPGGCSIATPVLNRHGTVLGTLALSSAEARVPLDKLIEYQPALLDAAARISAQLRP